MSSRPEGGDLGAVRLRDMLGLDDEELCRVLDADPLTILAGELDGRPELPILLTLLNEAEERVGAAALRRWVRTGGTLELLLARDFAAFEERLSELAERGFVIRAGRRQ